MKSSDRTILVALPLIAAAIGLWLLVIGPKQDEASELQDRADTLEAEYQAVQAEVATAEGARDGYERNYSALVSLGAAAPETDDQATLLNDLATLGNRNSVIFSAFTVNQASGAEAVASVPAAPATTESTVDGSAPADEAAPATGTEPVTATATETTAATLPIGAVVGPAGLSVMPYEVTFNGTFFNGVDFLADLDSAVEVRETGAPIVHGRLLTVSGFSFDVKELSSLPNLVANYALTSYLVPPEQGIDAGATPAGPAPVSSPEAPTTVTSTPTATVTP